MTRCRGCGAVLQNQYKDKEGYALELSFDYCERCFKITHYNQYKFSDKSNDYYLNIVKNIGKTNDLVILVTDFLNINSFNDIDIKNKVILVLAKRDIIPYNLDEVKLLSKINTNLNIVDKIVICSKNNYHFDELMDKIKKHQTSENVYVIGYTNAGKSTLINQINKNYGNINHKITTSNLPSTTLDLIEMKINDDLTLIDTPGLLDQGSAILKVESSVLKKITPKKEIKPKVIQVKIDQTIVVDNLFRMDVKDKVNLVFYFSNNLEIKRFYKETDILNDLDQKIISIKKGEDLVIKGLGFIKCLDDTEIKLYLDKDILYFTRQSII